MTLDERGALGEAIRLWHEDRKRELHEAGQRMCSRCYVLLPAEWFSPRRSHCRECEVQRVTAYLRRKAKA